jgi:nucleoside-diphosphate-sugar epimerase
VKALVTGASGCLGWALCEALLADPRISEVRGLVRRPDAALPEGVVRVLGELGDAESLKTAAEGVNLAFHLAALVHAPEQSPEAFHESNVVGTGRLLDALDLENPPRVVFFSTVAVYGEETPARGISEGATPAPATPYAKSKLSAEKLVLVWSRDTGGLSAILRVATVYGARDRGNIAKMLEAIAQKRFVLPGGGHNRKTLVAAQNVAAAAVATALSPSALLAELPPFVVADPKPVTLRELSDACIEALETTWRPPALPLFAAHLLARATGRGRQVKRLAASNVYVYEILRKIPGYLPRATLSEGLEQAAAERRAKNGI